MPLTLEVVGRKAAQMGGAVRKVFEGAGTIGRLRDNDWVLPDEYISGRHARITYADGDFLIEDTSTNGVFINSPQNRLTRGKPVVLHHGDTVFIDDYEVRVSLDAGRVAYGGADPFASDDTGPGAAEEADPLVLLRLQTPRTPPPGPSATSLAGNSPLSQHYRPPDARPRSPITERLPPSDAPPAPADQALIPDDYDPFAPEEPAPSARPPREPTPLRGDFTDSRRAAGPETRAAGPETRAAAKPRAPAAAAPLRPSPGSGSAPRNRSAAGTALESSPAGAPPPPLRATAPAEPRAAPPRVAARPAGELDFAALLAAAGIDSVRASPELAAQFGQILRVVVTGLMDVLRTRERIKDEFRMRLTTFKAADNNPLKFSANVEDALHNLLVKRNAAYLGPVEAFEDAFEDVRNHQMAMLAGVRVAYQSMLDEFDPGRLQAQFDASTKSGSFLGGSKQKYWELYRNKFHAMVKDADDSFRSLFGDEFAKAYEEQLERLRMSKQPDRR